MALRIDYSHSLRPFDAHVELTVAAGETLALVGPSGAGKTTTLRVVAGLLRPDRGMVAVDGETWLDTSAGLEEVIRRVTEVACSGRMGDGKVMVLPIANAIDI
jgi:ABC-type sulfate/molybdate transport systems ATPase subunit